jgi:hypothetical protein
MLFCQEEKFFLRCFADCKKYFLLERKSIMLQAPIGVTPDYLLGYHSGQRLVKFSPNFNELEVKNIAQRRWKKASETIRVDRTEFVLGVMDGYHDETAGIAHPLPNGGEEY